MRDFDEHVDANGHSVGTGEGSVKVRLDDRDDGGTTAILHGMMGMLSEVLDGIDRRIAGLEKTIATSQSQMAAAVTQAVEALAPRLERQSEKDSKLQAGIHVLGDRLAALEAVVSENPVRGLETRLGAIEAVLEGAGDTAAAAADAIASRLDRLREDMGERLDAIQPFDASFYPAIHAVADRLAESDDIVAVAMEDIRRLIDERLDSSAATFISASLVELGSAYAAGHSDVLAGLADINRRLIDMPSTADVREEASGDDSEAEVLAAIAELRERMAKPRPIDEAIKAGVKRLDEKVAEVEARVQTRGGDDVNVAVSALADRLEGLQAAVDVLGSRVGHSHSEITVDVRAAMTRLQELSAAVAGVGTEVGTVADGIGRLQEDGGRTQLILDAISSSSVESHERLRALHAALTKRFDASVAGSQVTDAVASALDRFRSAVDGQASVMQQLRSSVEELAASMETGVNSIGRRQAAVYKMVERVIAGMEDEQRGMEGLHRLAQSLSGALEQGSSMGGRVADLVLESRSALRADVERLESAIHLEAVKQQQQSQAHLSQAVATVGDVVERESSMLAQRVSAMTAAVETIRTVLHTQIDEPSAKPQAVA